MGAVSRGYTKPNFHFNDSDIFPPLSPGEIKTVISLYCIFWTQIFHYFLMNILDILLLHAVIILKAIYFCN